MDNELREKKADIVNAYHSWRKHCEKLDQQITEFTPRQLYEQTASYFADQLLSLLDPEQTVQHYNTDCPQCYENLLKSGVPEQIRKEERERIIDKLRNLMVSVKTTLPRQFSKSDLIQALKDRVNKK